MESQAKGITKTTKMNEFEPKMMAKRKNFTLHKINSKNHHCHLPTWNAWKKSVIFSSFFLYSQMKSSLGNILNIICFFCCYLVCEFCYHNLLAWLCVLFFCYIFFDGCERLISYAKYSTMQMNWMDFVNFRKRKERAHKSVWATQAQPKIKSKC